MGETVWPLDPPFLPPVRPCTSASVFPMTLAQIPLILLIVGLNVGAQILLKLASASHVASPYFLNPYLFGGLWAYAMSTGIYLWLLNHLSLSLAYPLVMGLTVVLTVFSGMLFLKEAVHFNQWLGVGLMVSGLLAIATTKP